MKPFDSEPGSDPIHPMFSMLSPEEREMINAAQAERKEREKMTQPEKIGEIYKRRMGPEWLWLVFWTDSELPPVGEHKTAGGWMATVDVQEWSRQGCQHSFMMNAGFIVDVTPSAIVMAASGSIGLDMVADVVKIQRVNIVLAKSVAMIEMSPAQRVTPEDMMKSFKNMVESFSEAVEERPAFRPWPEGLEQIERPS